MPSVISVSIVVLLLIVLVQSEIKLNPNWVKPDIYSRGRLAKTIKSAVDDQEISIPNKNEEVEPQFFQEERKLNYNKEDLSIYYKKVVKFLIRKAKVKPFTRDPSDEDEFLIRTIHFKITKKQIEQLERSDDIHELDGLFSDIIYQSEGGSLNVIQEALLSWSDLLIIKSSEYFNWTYLKFVCFISGIILIAVLIKKRFKVHIIIALFLVAVLINFFGEYHFCNKKKEYEKLATLSTTERNPCDLKAPKGFSDYLGSFFSGSAKEKCIKHLMETYEPHFEFCDPLEVFLDVFNNILFKQISQFFIKFGDLSSILIARVSWPYGIVILPMMLWLLVIIIKLCFKYIFLTAKEVITSKREPTSIAGPSSEHMTELAEIARTSLRLLETRGKRKIRKRILNKNKQIENRIEPLPQITDVTDVSDSENVNSPPPVNEDNEFEIVPVVFEPSATETTSDDAIKKKMNKL